MKRYYHKVTDGRSHMSDLRRIKTSFGRWKGRKRVLQNILLGEKNIINLGHRRVFGMDWGSTRGMLCAYNCRIHMKRLLHSHFII
jgi:hypothetical protein